ncbi:MAG: hypothetical protein J7L80_04745 [Thermoplasmata archaeon]|nr:hypothetical protein [Thermoplasmata archaeon]
MEEGFIISNKIRKVVFIEIASGEGNLKRIAKKHHLMEQAVKNAAEELKAHKLIEEKDGYKLTEYGMKIFGKLKGTNVI